MIRMLVSPPQRAAQVLGVSSLALIAAAFFFEYGMGLHPCQMCLWQRYAHYAVIILTALSLLPNVRTDGRMLRIILADMALALAIGAGIAFWHSGVELKLLPGPSSCSAALSLDGDVSTLLDQMLASPAVRCDEVPWSFLGLSMANWNLAITLAMSIFAIMSLRKR